jgi:hypothetical protein
MAAENKDRHVDGFVKTQAITVCTIGCDLQMINKIWSVKTLGRTDKLCHGFGVKQPGDEKMNGIHCQSLKRTKFMPLH